jgi:tetratricopeptide (TPR) repeat protein
VSPIAASLRALRLQLFGDPEDQLREAEHTRELAPGQFLGHWCVGLALERAGRLSEAIAEHRRALELAEGAAFMSCVLARALALSGDAAEARERLLQVEKLPSPGACAYQRALVHLALGESEAALACLEEACDARDPWAILVKVDPMLEELRGDSRLHVVVERVFGAAGGD